jgi:hypothetical protein
MEIKTNKVFWHLQNSKSKYVIEQGGTRSGKTYNILIWLIVYGNTHKNKNYHNLP